MHNTWDILQMNMAAFHSRNIKINWSELIPLLDEKLKKTVRSVAVMCKIDQPAQRDVGIQSVISSQVRRASRVGQEAWACHALGCQAREFGQERAGRGQRTNGRPGEMIRDGSSVMEELFD